MHLHGNLILTKEKRLLISHIADAPLAMLKIKGKKELGS